MKTISAPRQGRPVLGFAPFLVDRQLGDRPGRLDAVHARHADVEEDQVGMVLLDQLDRLGAVLRLADDLELGPDLGQAGAQLFAQQPLVVGDHGSGGDGAGWLMGDCPLRDQ
jgi:hypothetical protein